MDFFDLLDSTPPAKKRKIGEHGASPQLTPEKCEEAHSTDVENDVFDEEHGPVLKKGGRCRGRHYKRALKEIEMSIEQRLKKWKLDEEFTICGGSKLGCITCMKYGAWCEREGADAKTKKKMKKKEKVHTGDVKSPRKSHGPAEADSGDEETHADIQHALQKGTYKPPVGTQGKRLKYSLKRHLSGSQHKKAAGARKDEDNEHVRARDVPSDAQMMFAYDEVKKSPMVPRPPL